MSGLFGSYHDGRSRAGLRIGIAAIAAVELLVETIQVAAQSQDPQHYPTQGGLARTLAAMPATAWVIYAMILLGLVGVALDRRSIIAGAWAIGWAALLSAWQTGVTGSPSRNAFFPGAVLFGWMLGELWASRLVDAKTSPRDARALRERLGEAGALGCLAAAYVGSCASKLLAGGVSWADGMAVRALVLRQQPVADWSWLLAWRDAIVEQPELGRWAATATLVIEGGAFLLLLGPRLRLVWALLLLGVHTAILLLCTMPYLEPMVLLVLLAAPWRSRPCASTTDDRPRMPRAMVLVLVAVVAIARLVAPWGWRDERAHRVSSR